MKICNINYIENKHIYIVKERRNTMEKAMN